MTNTLQSWLRRSAALALVGFAASAMAVPITYNFQGAMAGGQTVQGQFSYDLALMTTPTASTAAHSASSMAYSQQASPRP